MTGEMFRSVPVRPQQNLYCAYYKQPAKDREREPALRLLMDGHRKPLFRLQEGLTSCLGLKFKGKNSCILDIALYRISCMYKAGHPQITSGQVAWGLKPASVHAEGHGVDHETTLTWPISSHLWLPLNEPQGMPTVWKVETLRLGLKTL